MISFCKDSLLLRLSVSALLVIFLSAAAARGAVVASVDWDNSDGNADGVITGTLGGASVTLTTGTFDVDFPENGGVFLGTGTDWASNLGSDNVPGISDSGVFSEAAVIDMGTAARGRTVISFSEPVTNPTVLINFVHDNFVEFFFDPFMPLLVLVDGATLPGGGVIPSGIGPGNQVFTNSGEGDNSADSGFAVRLTGTFSEIGFDTSPGSNALDLQTVAMTVVATVPEPSSLALGLLGALGLTMVRRRVC
ncbi:PEP-CTERM sorting domain-containing protein [bacterium]|nr:PEP-CTERM sorting domain-containing protein [bacterium]